MIICAWTDHYDAVTGRRNRIVNARLIALQVYNDGLALVQTLTDCELDRVTPLEAGAATGAHVAAVKGTYENCRIASLVLTEALNEWRTERWCACWIVGI